MSSYPCRIDTASAKRKGNPKMNGKQVSNLIKCLIYDPPQLTEINPKWKPLNIDVISDPVNWNDQIAVIEVSASIYRFGFFMRRGKVNEITQCCSCLTPAGAWYDLETVGGNLPETPIAHLTRDELDRLAQRLKINKDYHFKVVPTWSVMVHNGVHREFVSTYYDKGTTKNGKTFPKELNISPHFFDEEGANKACEQFESYFRAKLIEPESNTKKKKK